MKKIITIFAFTVISFTANADGNTDEVNQFINTHTGVNVLRTSESTTHPQPSRRDAAGAVLLDIEPIINNDNINNDVKLKME